MDKKMKMPKNMPMAKVKLSKKEQEIWQRGYDAGFWWGWREKGKEIRKVLGITE